MVVGFPAYIYDEAMCEHHVNIYISNLLLDVPEELDCKGRCNALQLSRTSLVATRQA